jgi:hypothetical protein
MIALEHSRQENNIKYFQFFLLILGHFSLFLNFDVCQKSGVEGQMPNFPLPPPASVGLRHSVILLRNQSVFGSRLKPGYLQSNTSKQQRYLTTRMRSCCLHVVFITTNAQVLLCSLHRRLYVLSRNNLPPACPKTSYKGTHSNFGCVFRRYELVTYLRMPGL